MMVQYEFSVVVNGQFIPGLKPVWREFHSYAGRVSDLKAFAPPIREVGYGYYAFAWNPNAVEAAGDIDCGVINDDGPIRFQLTRESPQVLRLAASVLTPDTTTAS